VAEKGFCLKYPRVKSRWAYFAEKCDGGWNRVSSEYDGCDKTIFTEADIPELQEKFPEINFDKLERVMADE